MSLANERRITGTEAASAYSKRMSEFTEARLVRAEVLARLAISLAGTTEPPLNERSASSPAAELTDLLTHEEIIKLPTAEFMLKTIERGYNG